MSKLTLTSLTALAICIAFTGCRKETTIIEQPAQPQPQYMQPQVQPQPQQAPSSSKSSSGSSEGGGTSSGTSSTAVPAGGGGGGYKSGAGQAAAMHRAVAAPIRRGGAVYRKNHPIE